MLEQKDLSFLLKYLRELEDFGSVLFDNFLGSGVGIATNAARHGGHQTIALNESFYYKTAIELGIFGIIAIVILYAIIVYETFIAQKDKQENESSVFTSAL